MVPFHENVVKYHTMGHCLDWVNDIKMQVLISLSHTHARARTHTHVQSHSYRFCAGEQGSIEHPLVEFKLHEDRGSRTLYRRLMASHLSENE